MNNWMAFYLANWRTLYLELVFCVPVPGQLVGCEPGQLGVRVRGRLMSCVPGQLGGFVPGQPEGCIVYTWPAGGLCYANSVQFGVRSFGVQYFSTLSFSVRSFGVRSFDVQFFDVQ
jgi:hypothetical protein